MGYGTLWLVFSLVSCGLLVKMSMLLHRVTRVYKLQRDQTYLLYTM